MLLAILGLFLYCDSMTVLGIETSCDETSAAIVYDGHVKSNVISSQYVHSQYGGVVPELASRAHQRMVVEVVQEALRLAGIDRRDIDGVAATYGPGLAGALLVGLNFGKALAYGLDAKFVGINHLEGHLFSNSLTSDQPEFPFVSLIVSGGHTLLIHVREPFKYTVLGQSLDDAAGEAFDKVAKMLGLGYPGGPVIDRLAREGNPRAIAFPRPYLKGGSLDFSFSGLKTAVLYYLRDLGIEPGNSLGPSFPDAQVKDICASFQAAVVDVLVDKTIAAADRCRTNTITIGGGVSANSGLRDRLAAETARKGMRLFFPPLEYCMDNGAMIAYVGWLRLRSGMSTAFDLPAVPNLEFM